MRGGSQLCPFPALSVSLYFSLLLLCLSFSLNLLSDGVQAGLLEETRDALRRAEADAADARRAHAADLARLRAATDALAEERRERAAAKAAAAAALAQAAEHRSVAQAGVC